MNNDELDQWLKEFDTEETPRQEREHQAAKHRLSEPADALTRSSLFSTGWVRPTSIGAGVLAAVAVALVFFNSDSQRRPTVDHSEPRTSTIPATTSPPNQFEDRSRLETPSPVVTVATPPLDTSSLPPSAPENTDTDASGDPQSYRDAVSGSAVAALRSRLTFTGTEASDGTTSYLEHATVIERQRLSDEAVAVVLDAVWIESRPETEPRVVRGRWVVPINVDGVVLATPWPHDVAGVSFVSDAPSLPTGTDGTENAVATLEQAGWTSVAVHAVSPHPYVPDMSVASVSGVPPGSSSSTEEIVWLSGSPAEGLNVLGSSLQQGTSTDEA